MRLSVHVWQKLKLDGRQLLSDGIVRFVATAVYLRRKGGPLRVMGQTEPRCLYFLTSSCSWKAFSNGPYLPQRDATKQKCN